MHRSVVRDANVTPHRLDMLPIDAEVVEVIPQPDNARHAKVSVVRRERVPDPVRLPVWLAEVERRCGVEQES